MNKEMVTKTNHIVAYILRYDGALPFFTNYKDFKAKDDNFTRHNVVRALGKYLASE